MCDTLSTEITGVCRAIWLRGSTKENAYLKKKKASCPQENKPSVIKTWAEQLGCLFEDKTEQWTIWIMYCSTRMTENKHWLSRCSCHAWISRPLSQESLKAVSLQEHVSPGVSQRDFMHVVFVSLSRVKLNEGVTFLGARPSNPTQWMVSQDVRSEGHRVVTLHCRRKESGFDQQRSVKNLLRPTVQ